jgi:LysM repeat protein
MTSSQDESPASEAAPVAGLCPFLRSRDGGWASNHASRELRCWAVRPPAQPAIPKQRGLCLLVAHAGCATFVTAMAADAVAPGSSGDGAADLWPASRTTPVALEFVRGRAGLPVASPRSGGQALLVALMVLAFLVLVIARTSAPGTSSDPPGASAAPSVPASAPAAVTSPSPAGSPSPSAGTPAPSPSPVASPSPKPSARPTARPSRSPVPSATSVPSGSQTYVVQKNDTLSSIAAKFHTTVKALASANGITDPRVIHPGQVLVIP